MTEYEYRYEYAGHFTSEGRWIHPVSCISTWEILYMISGTAALFEEDRSIEAHAGDVVLFAPQKEHGGYRESTEKVSFFWLHLTPADPEAEQRLRSLPFCASLLYPAQISVLFRQLLHHAQTQSYPKEMNDGFASLLVLEYAAQSRLTGQRESLLLHTVCEWIRTHIRQPLSVQQIADQFQYNRDYLSRLFVSSFGIGLKAYLDAVRMDAVRNLLLTTDEPLKSIAAQTGFEDYKAFLKFFTYHESVSPTAFLTQYYRTHTNHK